MKITEDPKIPLESFNDDDDFKDTIETNSEKDKESEKDIEFLDTKEESPIKEIIKEPIKDEPKIEDNIFLNFTHRSPSVLEILGLPEEKEKPKEESELKSTLDELEIILKPKTHVHNKGKAPDPPLFESLSPPPLPPRNLSPTLSLTSSRSSSPIPPEKKVSKKDRLKDYLPSLFSRSDHKSTKSLVTDECGKETTL